MTLYIMGMLRIVTGTGFGKLVKHPLVLHLLVLFLISFFTIGTNYSRNFRTLGAMPSVLSEAVIERVDNVPSVGTNDLKKADAKKVSKTTVIASPSPSPLQAVLGKNAPSDSSRNTLCKGVTDSWKMVSDPKSEGLYVICNTTSEKMTTAGELNAAQNSYRVEHGLNTLNINSKLCEVAAGRAKEVSKNFSHDGFKSAVEGSGLGKSSYGENIASGPLTGVHFVEWSWDKSSGHRANMLGDWTDGCAGVNGKYAVFLFAK